MGKGIGNTRAHHQKNESEMKMCEEFAETAKGETEINARSNSFKGKSHWRKKNEIQKIIVNKAKLINVWVTSRFCFAHWRTERVEITEHIFFTLGGSWAKAITGLHHVGYTNMGLTRQTVA